MCVMAGCSSGVSLSGRGTREGIPKVVDKGSVWVRGGGHTSPRRRQYTRVRVTKSFTPRDRIKDVYRSRREDQQ